MKKKQTKFKETEIGRIPEDWNLVLLHTLSKKITKGTTPTTLKKKFTESGINFVKVESIGEDGFFDKSKFMFIDDETNELLNRSKFEENDIVYTIAGTIGRVAVVSKEILPANTNQAVAIIRLKEKTNIKFLRYSLINPKLENYLISKTVHAVQANLSLTELGNAPIIYPSDSEQGAIAKILSDLDSNIELNRQISKTLEKTGQALFQHWFVDFEFPEENGEPYKSSGGEMVDSELGKIPKGWGVKALRDTVSGLESGRRPRGGAIAEGIPSIGAENVNGLGNYDYTSTKYVSEDFFKQMKTGIVMDYDILLYKDGAYIGKKTMVGRGFPFSKCCVNEHVFILRVQPSIGQFYLYFYLNQPSITEQIKQLNTNSAQPGLNKESLGGLEVLIPDQRLLADFTKIVQSIIDKILNNSIENEVLSQIRDSLLPRLMSGKIRVSVGSES